MISIQHSRRLALATLAISVSTITACSSDFGEIDGERALEGEVAEVASATVSALPDVFDATIQNASDDGITNKCLIFYGAEQWESPARYLWSTDDTYCGFGSKEELLANRQAVFRFRSLGDDLYTISHALGGTSRKCLMFYGTAPNESPTRYNWGVDNDYCGFASKEALIENKQAVWKLKRVQGDKFTLSHTLTNQCLIFGGNGHMSHPERYMWSQGSGDCGWDTQANLLANQQAVFTIKVRQDASASPHWSYEGAEGPAHWGDISPSYAACSEGLQQSPINLAGAGPATLDNIYFTYNATPLTVVNNGHTIQANVDAGSYMTVGGSRYDLLQFHFHTPSEHTINGVAAPLELHFVHKNAAGELAVVGVLMQQSGGDNADLAPVWQNMPSHAGDSATVSNPLDISRLLPANKLYYAYAGSLTTPPCTEGVRWQVMQNPISVSAGQIAAFQALFPMNARPVQPIGVRGLLLSFWLQ